MKRFSQFLGIHRGSKHFKQAPNAILVQDRIFDCPYSDCTKIKIIITGDEAFTFQSGNNTLYYKNSDFINIPHEDIVYATCTHFAWGSGAVIADMKDGEFIFNYTKASGIGTGNISFKRNDLFDSNANGKAWFRELYANGTPVTITVYVKK